MVYSQEFHWRLAARWAGYTWEGFTELEGYQQSYVVAAYETSLRIEAVTMNDSQKEARKKNAGMRKRGSGGG